MSSLDNLALYERERLEPPEGEEENMLERNDQLERYLLELQDDRNDLANFSPRNLSDELLDDWKRLKERLLYYYDSEQDAKSGKLRELQDELAGMGYAV